MVDSGATHNFVSEREQSEIASSFAYDKSELDGAKWEAELEWETTDAACNSYSSFWTYFIPLPLACPFFWSIDELAFVDERAFVFPGVLLFLPESAILYLIYKEPIP